MNYGPHHLILTKYLVLFGAVPNNRSTENQSAILITFLHFINQTINQSYSFHRPAKLRLTVEEEVKHLVHGPTAPPVIRLAFIWGLWLKYTMINASVHWVPITFMIFYSIIWSIMFFTAAKRSCHVYKMKGIWSWTISTSKILGEVYHQTPGWAEGVCIYTVQHLLHLCHQVAALSVMSE